MTSGQMHVIGYGLGGDHAYGKDFTRSGYGSPENPHINLNDPNAEGAWLIDKREAVTKNPSLAFRSPMCHPGIAGDYEPFAETLKQASAVFVKGLCDASPINAGLLALGASPASADKPGPLDYVSPAVYVQWWRNAGARIGRVVNGRAEWE